MFHNVDLIRKSTREKMFTSVTLPLLAQVCTMLQTASHKFYSPRHDVYRSYTMPSLRPSALRGQV
jgi:hypothetical protein